MTKIPLPKGQWDVIVADPPWMYYGQQDKWGAAAKFYETLSDDKILKFPMYRLMTAKSVLFLWTTSARIDFSIYCISRWGLYFRGIAFVWIKTKADGEPIGAQGVRPSITKPLCEFVLAASTVATGRPLPLSDESVTQTVFAPKREHSRKPDQVQDQIDRMYPDASKIELFARYRRNGWDSWGLEL